MEVKVVSNKNEWENFLFQQKEKSFLQSWAWGEFQEKQENRIWRLGLYENKNLVAVALVVKVVARRGTFLMIQHLCDIGDKYLEILVEKTKEIGKEEKVDFIRIAPLYLKNEENAEIFKKLSLREAPMNANAYEATWKLDLSTPEDDLLKNMRKTTRYLIKQAQKNLDISIEKSENINNIEIYQKLNREVAKRQHFVAFSTEYIKNEFEVFEKDKQTLWLFGKVNNEVAAGALVIFWSGVGFYHQAASLGKYAKLSIPYLLQWEAIKEAKNRGCKFYDFWGFTDPQKYPKHPWAGPTLFKMGYGGFATEYIKTQDYPLSKKYWLTYAFETLRKIRRGFN
jgi:lipid II:glycine glycyltransferase (peptidoglycan interpeptide bridge formation enzyme)